MVKVIVRHWQMHPESVPLDFLETGGLREEVDLMAAGPLTRLDDPDMPRFVVYTNFPSLMSPLLRVSICTILLYILFFYFIFILLFLFLSSNTHSNLSFIGFGGHGLSCWRHDRRH
jgi:hypothetical protein